MIVFEIWNIEQGKWIEVNFATIPLGHYYLRIKEVKVHALEIIPRDIGKNEGNS